MTTATDAVRGDYSSSSLSDAPRVSTWQGRDVSIQRINVSNLWFYLGSCSWWYKLPRRICDGIWNTVVLCSNPKNFFSYTGQLLKKGMPPNQFRETARMQVLGREMLLVTNPWMSESILKANNRTEESDSALFDGGTIPTALEAVFHRHVISPPKQVYTSLKKGVDKPLLGVSSLKSYVPIMVENAQKLIEQQIKPPEHQFNVTKYCPQFASKIISQCLIGYQGSTDEVTEKVDQLHSVMLNHLHNPFSNFSQEAQNLIVNAKKRIRELTEEHYSKDSATFMGEIRKMANTLAGSDPSQEDFFFEALISGFFFAGQETTGSGLGSALFMLGHHPQWQEKIYQEYRLRCSDSALPYEYLTDKNTKLHKVFLEVFRLYPPPGLQSRRARCDLTIRVGQETHYISKGTDILLMYWYMGRDERLWGENPEFFNPERFEDPCLNEIPWLPFSIGPNICTGRKLAELEIKTFILTLLSQYTWTSLQKPEDVQWTLEIAIKPDHDLHISLTPRKKVE